MSTLLGLGIVIGSVFGGFAMGGGHFGVLLQPNELVVIGGAALGTLVISAPGRVRSRVTHAFKMGFKSTSPTEGEYLDLLLLLYQLFQAMRREGVLALESHLQNPAQSAIFSKYPSVLKRHESLEFLVDGLRQLVDGCSAEDLTLLLDSEMETQHEEHHQPIALIKSTGDALPGLGIVAAVLGIVITMGHLDGGPAEIGHHVAAALVGTFLGILLCYGVLAPIASSVEMQAGAAHRYCVAIKDSLIAAARGTSPVLCVEFARRAIFTDERPTSAKLNEAIEALKKG